MNILKKALLIPVMFLLLPLTLLCPQAVDAAPLTWQGESEFIDSFDSLIEIQENADLVITETIKVTTINNAIIKHGIYRDFPTIYAQGTFIREVDFSLYSVKMDGNPIPYHTETVNNGIRVYLGDANEFLDPGIYTYTIQYRTNRQLGYFEDHDELYFNITGNGWSFPIVESTARIIFPGKISGSTITADGFTGPFNSVAKNFSSQVVEQESGTEVIYKTTQPLAAEEGLTVSLFFPKDIIAEPGLLYNISAFIKANWVILAGALVLFWTTISSLLFWWFKGRDPKSGTIIPLFTPPQDLSPAQVRYLYKMEADDKAMAAAVVNLAVKGILNLSEEKGTYTIINLAPEEEISLSQEEKVYHNYLFPGNVKDDFVELKQSTDTTLSNAAAKFKSSLENFNKTNKYVSNTFWQALLFCFIPYLLYCISFLVIKNPIQVGENGGMLIFTAFWLSISLAILPSLLLKSLKEAFGTKQAGKFAVFFMMTLFSAIFLGIGGVVTFITISAAVNPVSSFLVLLFLILPIALVPFLYKAMAKRTPAGRKVTDEILGFRMFLETADRERIKMLIPELPLNIGTNKANVDTSITRLKLFEYYLPYAVALDVEKQWSHHFAEDLAISPTDNHSYMSWYASSSAWSAASFASGFSSGLSSSISSASTAPGSSSGSGGSSGGGGGGGGGGGW